jgi:hypothetical protein
LQGKEKTRSAPNVGQQNWVLYKLAQPLIHFGGFDQFCNSAGLRSSVFLFLFLFFFIYIIISFFLSFLKFLMLHHMQALQEGLSLNGNGFLQPIQKVRNKKMLPL